MPVVALVAWLSVAAEVPSPTLIAPIADAFLDTRSPNKPDTHRWEFRWAEVPNATKYHILVIGELETSFVIDEIIAGTIHQADIDGSVAASASGWRWRVRALVDGIWGPWSELRTFHARPAVVGGTVALVPGFMPLRLDSWAFFDGHTWRERPEPPPWSPVDPSPVISFRGHEGAVTAVALAPNGRLLASGSADRTIKLWDLTNLKLRATLRGHAAEVSCLAFSTDGLVLASGGRDRTIRLWDIEAGRERSSLKETSRVTALAWSSDGETLASGGPDGVVTIWDVTTGRARRTIEGHSGTIWALSVVDDTWIAAGVSDHRVNIWEIATGNRAGTKEAWHGNASQVLTCSHDTRLLAVANPQDGTIGVRSAGKNIKFWLPGHRGGVHALAFGPGKHLLASGGRDRFVRVWDLPRGWEEWKRLEAIKKDVARQRQREREREWEREDRRGK